MGSIQGAGVGRKLFGLPRDKHKIVHRTVAAAVVGGTVSKIGGGKFSNGAITAAMVHLFNAEKVLSQSEESQSVKETIDPAVAKEMKQAWLDSQAADPKLRHEEGGYIVLNTDGTQGVVRWKSGGGAFIVPTPRAADGSINGLKVQGEFHTHPNPPLDEQGGTWIQGGHTGNWNAIRAEKYPGNSYISSRDHIYQVSPSGVETTLGTFEDILGK